ncbi:hypothetical protein [Ochrobactrum sp. AP1BH01-1]|uniref:hypothetical protein n=1 Tax=Ochrobactrum sp. AP1BH01-1 TaxID=2823874 RepID=UPI001B3677A6|nr:hypothetical protein [Ochrobactrum sp. AP1BH01-1]MBQ0710188.1 hypothetical protein [Ochrobactrum sp. AP1BH01-1]
MQKSGLLALALAVMALTACSETTPGPSASATPAKPPVDPTPITGNWCSPDGQRFAIFGERFDSRDSQCSVTRMNNYEGTFTVSMSCNANGQQSKENITISPVGQTLHISFLSMGGKRAVVSRCAS